MSSAREYDDGLIQLDGRAITLRRFHFPSGTSKVRSSLTTTKSAYAPGDDSENPVR